MSCIRNPTFISINKINPRRQSAVCTWSSMFTQWRFTRSPVTLNRLCLTLLTWIEVLRTEVCLSFLALSTLSFPIGFHFMLFRVLPEVCGWFYIDRKHRSFLQVSESAFLTMHFKSHIHRWHCASSWLELTVLVCCNNLLFHLTRLLLYSPTPSLTPTVSICGFDHSCGFLKKSSLKHCSII